LKVAVGIPAFNEEMTIAKVIVRARRHCDVVVVVDDGSTDDTALIADSLGAKVISHERRKGYGSAIRSCFEAARDLGADVLVTLDADGQHDADEIPKLLAGIKNGPADIAVGSRFSDMKDKNQAPRYRVAGIKLLTSLTETVSRAQLTDAQCGFRAYNRNAIERVAPTEQGMGASAEMLMKSFEENLRVIEVPVTVRYSGLETSTHNPLYHWLEVVASIIKFTSMRHPLAFYGGMSAIAASLALAFGVWTLSIYQKEGRVVTNLALLTLSLGIIAVVALFAAVILFTLITVIREIPGELRRSIGRAKIADDAALLSNDRDQSVDRRVTDNKGTGRSSVN
jgi:glycosyltransferase involved in cell wall biosynthesis